MNNFLQENLFAIILFLLFIILALIGLLAFVFVKLILNPKKQEAPLAAPTNHPPPKKEDIISLKKISEEAVSEKFFCENHPESPSVGGCLICEDVFCEKCLIEHDGMYFCKEHFKIFANNRWRQITDVRTTPDTPDDGLFIYHFKRKIWKEDQVPSFVLTHYKINLEQDFIESFIQLNVREGDAERLSHEIKKLE